MIPDQLETANLALRPFQPGDTDAVFAYWQSDASWAQFNASVPEDFEREDAENFVATMCQRDRAMAPNWAMLINDVVVGVVSLTFEQDCRLAVIGYGVHGELRGQGLSARAAAIVISAAFEHYAGLRKIRAHTDADNVASMRVLEKLGSSHEGTLRQNQFAKGRFVDEAVYGLLREEWGYKPS